MSLWTGRLRILVYASLLRTRQELGIGSQPLSLSAIASWVKQKAQQTGLLPPDTSIFLPSNYFDKARNGPCHTMPAYS